jgi:hypothetical protein
MHQVGEQHGFRERCSPDSLAPSSLESQRLNGVRNLKGPSAYTKLQTHRTEHEVRT